MTKTNSELSPDAFGHGIAALLADRLDGARLLWIGRDLGLSPLLERAEHALQLDLSTKRAAPLAPNHTRRTFREGRLRFRPASFDVILVPDLWDVPGDLLQLIEDVAEIGEGALLVFGAPYEGRAAYRQFVELIDEGAQDARLYGAVDFSGVSFAELGYRDPDIVVGSMGEPRYPQYILALGGDVEGVPAAFIAETRPTEGAADTTVLGTESEAAVQRVRDLESELKRTEAKRLELEEELSELKARLHAERAREEETRNALEASLDAAKAKIEDLEAEVSKKADAEREIGRLRRALDEAEDELADLREAEAERAHLMSRFEARGEEIVELRAELERRRVLLRDAVEEMRQLRRRGTGGSEDARRRALEAEYALEKLRHERDELKAALLMAERRAEEAEARSEAESGAPPAETPEVIELRKRLDELDIAFHESEKQNGRLHDKIAKLAEERAALNERIDALTAALDEYEASAAERAQPASSVDPRTDLAGGSENEQTDPEPIAQKRFPADVRSLLGERDGLRMRLAHTEAALLAERQRSDGSFALIEKLKEREVELMETRAKLGSQELALETQSELMRKLQRDLAAAERDVRELESVLDQDRAEAERLRDALVSALAENEALKKSAEAGEGDPEKLAALEREIDELREELSAQEDDLRDARARAKEAEEAADEARRLLLEAKEALNELRRENSAHEGES